MHFKRRFLASCSGWRWTWTGFLTWMTRAIPFPIEQVTLKTSATMSPKTTIHAPDARRGLRGFHQCAVQSNEYQLEGPDAKETDRGIHRHQTPSVENMV